jgi:hypothetical protein
MTNQQALTRTADESEKPNRSLPLISPTFFVSCENNIPAMMVAIACLR